MAKPAKYFLWCSELPGFGVRVFPSGKRVYYADYRNGAGVRKRMLIGHARQDHDRGSAQAGNR